MGRNSGTRFFLKVHSVFRDEREQRKKIVIPQKWECGVEEMRAGPGAHPGVAERGSGSLLSLVRGAGDGGPEEPLIPLRGGGEPRPSLGLACVDRGRLRGWTLPHACLR